MRKKGRTSEISSIHKLDSGHYMDIVNETRKLADKALQGHGKPSMSLNELRRSLAEHLPGVSLSEMILREREAGW